MHLFGYKTVSLTMKHIIPILKNDVALPNFTKCGGIGHKLTVCATIRVIYNQKWYNKVLLSFVAQSVSMLLPVPTPQSFSGCFRMRFITHKHFFMLEWITCVNTPISLTDYLKIYKNTIRSAINVSK